MKVFTFILFSAFLACSYSYTIPQPTIEISTVNPEVKAKVGGIIQDLVVDISDTLSETKPGETVNPADLLEKVQDAEADIAETVAEDKTDATDSQTNSQDPLQDMVTDALEDVNEARSDIADAVQDMLEDTMETMADVQGDAADAEIDTIDIFEDTTTDNIDTATDAEAAVADAHADAIDTVQDIISDSVDAVIDSQTDAVDSQADVVDTFQDMIADGIDTVVDAQTNAADAQADVVDTYQDIIEDNMDTAANEQTDADETMADVQAEAIEAFNDALDRIMELIPETADEIENPTVEDIVDAIMDIESPTPDGENVIEYSDRDSDHLLDDVDLEKLTDEEAEALMDANEEELVGYLDTYAGVNEVKGKNSKPVRRRKRWAPIVFAVGRALFGQLVKKGITRSGQRITKHYTKSGNYFSGLRDFKKLNPTNVKRIGNSKFKGWTGKVGPHSVTVRSGSKGSTGSNGPATFSITSKGGKLVRKIRLE